MPRTEYVTHFPLKRTGLGLRRHDPAYLINRLVPEGEVALSLDHGWVTGNPVTDPPPSTYEVVLLHGRPHELLKQLEQVASDLRSLIAHDAKKTA